MSKQDNVYILYKVVGHSEPEILQVYRDWNDAKQAKKELKKELTKTERLEIVEYPLI